MAVIGYTSNRFATNIQNKHIHGISQQNAWLYDVYSANARYLMSDVPPTRQTPIIIPDETTKINANAYKDQSIFSMPEYLPESVTEIGDYAFYNNWIPKGYSLVIPSTVKSIGESAFVTVYPNNATSSFDIGAEHLGKATFGYRNISHLTIRNTVKSCDAYPFNYANIIRGITIEHGLTYLPPLFTYTICYADIIIPDSVTEIAPLTFRGYLPEGAGFRGTILIPGSVKVIKANTFYYSQTGEVTKVVFEEGVESLELGWASQQCMFKEVHIPSTLSLTAETFNEGIYSVGTVYINRPKGYFDTSVWTTEIGEIIWTG